jgi:predicted nucleotidyltransferase
LRVRQVNGRDELTHRVTEVRVFGSYLTDAETLGDIDLAVSLEGKQAEAETAGMDWIQVCLSRAAESGRRFKTYGDQLRYSEIEVKRFLKARSPYLSFHALDELARLGCRSEVLFKM